MNMLETILVVDDEAMVRMNMRAFLEDLGFQVVEASSGSEAIAAAKWHGPHLILLDITMPDMDGFEACRRLKADPLTEATPVIFISALLSTADKVMAFACGGVDYVTKPFEFEEVEARIRAHLELHRQRRQLKAQHEALCNLEKQRDSFIHMMAHDMRGPLIGVMGYLEIAKEGLPQDCPDVAADLDRALGAAGMLNAMITQMLELSRLESESMPLRRCLCDLVTLTREAMESLPASQRQRRIQVKGVDSALVWCDPSIVGRILGNLLGNAWKFTSEGGMVEIQVTRSEASVRVAVVDDGPGISPEHLGNVFDKFAQTPDGLQKGGFGLGLAFCKFAVEAHHGEIGVESELGKGCTFWFTLPVEAQPEEQEIGDNDPWRA